MKNRNRDRLRIQALVLLSDVYKNIMSFTANGAEIVQEYVYPIITIDKKEKGDRICELACLVATIQRLVKHLW
jgi:hypothetical protein